MTMISVNPTTGETLQTWEETSPRAVGDAVEAAHARFESWRWSEFSERAEYLLGAARELRHRAGDLAELMAREMGKPVREGRAEAEKCAWVCEYYAERAQSLLEPEVVDTDAAKSYVTFRPLGVLLAVMPWNFPLWQVFRFAAPTLMAGNTALLKHASNVPGCALAVEQVLASAGLPEGCFRTLLLGASRVGDLVEHPLVRAVTLTGSTPAGRSLAAAAGAQLKKTVLELGGSDPYVVLEDADLPSAAKACVDSRLINGGQSCIAAKRFIVPESRRNELEELFVSEMGRRKVGDPLDEDTDLGPLARHDLRDELHLQVGRSLDRGASLLVGGEVPEGPGAFYPPTVLTSVRKGMPAYDEELFGPVAAIIPVETEDQAIEVANDTSFGLGAAVFTRDVARGEAIAADRLEAGSCFVNSLVKSDPRLPFGGIKESGYGRELGAFGIREFVNVKTVYVS